MKMPHGCCFSGNQAAVGPSPDPHQDATGAQQQDGIYHMRTSSPEWHLPVLKPQSRRPTLMEGDEYAENNVPRLTEALWTLQRARIGLPTRTRLADSERKQLQEWNFVSSSFCRKECVLYSCGDEQGGNSSCCCGAPAPDHNTCPTFIGTDYTSSLDGRPTVPRAWDESFAIHEFPTNAFGMLTLVRKDGNDAPRPIPYLRLADSSDSNLILTLLQDYWSLHVPNLVMCVATSGDIEEDLHAIVRPAILEAISAGIVRAARSTKAWVLTDGSDEFPSGLVADALSRGRLQATGQSRKVLPCIGVASWGRLTTHRRRLLINDDITSLNHARMDPWVRWDLVAGLRLNASHTHLLLVDDGFRFQKCKRSGAAALRWNLASAVSAPRVLLLLGGGISALREALGVYLVAPTPVIAITNTGGAADVLATSEKLISSNRELELNQILRNAFPKHRWSDGELEGVQEDIQRLCKAGNLTIVDVEADPHLDAHLLAAVMQSGDMSTRDAQLRLALQWDRPDLAEGLFQSGTSPWEGNVLQDILQEALLLDRVGFVRLLLAQGVDLHLFVGSAKLRDLYQEAADEPHGVFRKLVSRNLEEPLTLHMVHRILCRLMGQHSESVYQQSSNGNEETKFQDPTHELLLWSVLTNRLQVAQYLQTVCDSPMLGAVVAASMCGALVKCHPEHAQLLKEHRASFQETATQLADACLDVDCELAACILERPLASWNQKTILQLAARGRLKQFLCAKCCQQAVSQSWKRGFQDLSPVAIVLGLIFPPLVLWTNLTRPLQLGDRGGIPTPAQILLAFYKAPATKFAGHAICWLSLLILQSHVLLRISWKPGAYAAEEAFMWLWLGTVLIEEIREIQCHDDNSGACSRVTIHLKSSAWNQLDFVAILMAIVAFFLRHLGPTQNSLTCMMWTRALMAMHTALMYLRVFRIYHAHSLLGPKLVAFHRMIPHVFVFLLLLLVFALAYGVAAQVLLGVKQGETSWEWIRLLFLRPYWQMYGELQLEELQEEEKVVEASDATSLAWLAQLFLAVYLLFSNVMLLNLLIAIFTKVFESVESRSEELWRYQMALLLEEFDSRPLLAPPLSPVYLLYRLLLSSWRQLDSSPRPKNLDTLPPTAQQSLRAFEHDCAYALSTRTTPALPQSQLDQMQAQLNRILATVEAKAVDPGTETQSETHSDIRVLMEEVRELREAVQKMETASQPD